MNRKALNTIMRTLRNAGGKPEDKSQSGGNWFRAALAVACYVEEQPGDFRCGDDSAPRLSRDALASLLEKPGACASVTCNGTGRDTTESVIRVLVGSGLLEEVPYGREGARAGTALRLPQENMKDLLALRDLLAEELMVFIRLKPGDVVVFTPEAKGRLELGPEAAGELVVMEAFDWESNQLVTLHNIYFSKFNARWLSRRRHMSPGELGRFVLDNGIMTRGRAERIRPGAELELTPRALRAKACLGETMPGTVTVAEVVTDGASGEPMFKISGTERLNFRYFRFPKRKEKP